jgi:hypothetical protein
MFNNHSKSNSLNVIYVGYMILRCNTGYVLQGFETQTISQKYFITGIAEIP